MEASPKGISQDAQRHVGTYVHHVERSKDERLDRQDGTGRGHEGPKRGGGGKGNWGKPGDEVEDLPLDLEADEEPQAVSPRDFVENEKVLTLDEYEKQKATEVQA